MASIEGLERELRAVVGGLDPARLEAGEAARLVERFVALEKLCSAGRVLLAPRAAESSVWRDRGESSPAGWLARESGSSVADAQRVIDTGKRLEGLDATADALRAGKLSGSQVVEVAKTAVDAPGCEARLLAAAQIEDAAGLRKAALAERAHACRDPQARAAKIHARRSLRTWTDDEGARHLIAQGPAHELAFVEAAVAHQRHQVLKQARTENRREPLEAYDFDALIELCRTGGNKPLPSGAGAKIIVRLDARPGPDGATVFDDTVEILGVGHAPAAILDQLEGAFWAAVLWDGTDVFSVAHLGRKPTAAQVTALQARDGQCQTLGCSRTTRLEMDHEHDWAQTHRTWVRELIDHCKHHHDLKTRQNWRLVKGQGRRAMVPPDHPDHPTNKPERPP